MRWTTWLLVPAISLFLLPLLALGSLRLIGLDVLRPWIEQRAASALDRPVAIEGGLVLGGSFPPTLLAQGLVLGPRPGEGEELARIGRLELQPALLPLLNGRLVIDRLALADATILLPAERSQPTGGGTPAAPAAAATPARRLPTVHEARLERVRIRLPATAGRPPQSLLIARLEAALAEPQGPLRLVGEGELEGRPLAVELALDSPQALLEGRPARLAPLTLALADSDLAGSLTLDPGGPRPRLEGDLASRRLDLTMLAALFGKSGEGAAADDGTGAGDRRTRRRVIPDAPIDLAALRGVEARIELRVGELSTGGPSLRDLVLPIEIGNGRLVAGPITAALAGGRLAGRIEADGAPGPAALRLELELRGVATAELQRELGGEASVEASLDLDLELSGRGPSTAALLASAEGELTAALGAGRVRAVALDRIAGGVREAIRALASQGSEGWVELRCAVLDLPIRAGIAELRAAVVETARARLTGEGRVDLGSERLDLTLLPRSRGVTLNLAVPVRLRGTLAAPEIALDQREAARRAALGLLGAFAFPPAALAAFVDLGAGSNPCLAGAPPPAEAAPPAAAPRVPGADTLRRGLEGLFGPSPR